MLWAARSALLQDKKEKKGGRAGDGDGLIHVHARKGGQVGIDSEVGVVEVEKKGGRARGRARSRSRKKG